MWFNFLKKFKQPRRDDLDPDEILLDSSNLSSFNKQQFEGQLEKPIGRLTLYVTGAVFSFIFLLLFIRIGYLEIARGQAFSARSESNSLRHTAIFAERGIIYDRTGEELAWNNPDHLRTYISLPGLAHVLGFVGYPDEKQAAQADYENKEVVGREGVERAYDSVLAGEKGIKIEETDVSGKVVSDYLLQTPVSGESLNLSIDAKVESQLYAFIKSLAVDKGFHAGAGVIMNVKTGEILALTSYPEYDPNLVSTGNDPAAIKSYLTNPQSPFLNRVIDGLYTPGSTVKPIIATAALSEKIISPDKIINTNGKLVVPNPYDPKNPSVFKDWRNNGPVDLRTAIAYSCDVYFYEIGGGFGSQPGLGISKIDQYARLFGLSAPTGLVLGKEASGVIPTPEWKKENFDGEDWRLGDTYHTSIGQYGFLVTPLQMVRAVAAIANGGTLITPTLLKDNKNNLATSKNLGLNPANLQIVREGMRGSATIGTGMGLSVPYVKLATKTGTAELGVAKDRVNAWVEGFWPYENPEYAFTVVMERGRVGNTVGGVFVMRQLVDWMHLNTPQYLGLPPLSTATST